MTRVDPKYVEWQQSVEKIKKRKKKKKEKMNKKIASWLDMDIHVVVNGMLTILQPLFDCSGMKKYLDDL